MKNGHPILMLFIVNGQTGSTHHYRSCPDIHKNDWNNEKSNDQDNNNCHQ